MSNNLKIMVNSISVSYQDSGTGKIPIIFIHGFPFDKTMWQPQFDALKTTNRVITYDIRGFGQSGSNNDKASIDLYADDLVKFMKELKIEKSIACGLSMGGYILLNAVERYPQYFKAIILSDTQCLADSEEGKEKRYKTIKEIHEKGLDEFATGFIKNAFCKESQLTKKDLVEKIKQVILSTSPETITAALTAMAERKESCSPLKNISIPTLILCGGEDVLTTIAQSEFLFNNIPNARMHAIEKAGHLSNLEQAGTFTEHIHNFIPDFLS